MGLTIVAVAWDAVRVGRASEEKERDSLEMR